MPHSGNAAVVGGTGGNGAESLGISPASVQKETTEYAAKNAGNSASSPRVLDKPYISALHAAELLGCDRAAVVADIKAGMRGDLAALCGAVTGDICVVARWDLEGERLAMHRARLADPKDVVRP